MVVTTIENFRGTRFSTFVRSRPDSYERCTVYLIAGRFEFFGLTGFPRSRRDRVFPVRSIRNVVTPTSRIKIGVTREPDIPHATRQSRSVAGNYEIPGDRVGGAPKIRVSHARAPGNNVSATLCVPRRFFVGNGDGRTFPRVRSHAQDTATHVPGPTRRDRWPEPPVIPSRRPSRPVALFSEAVARSAQKHTTRLRG